MNNTLSKNLFNEMLERSDSICILGHIGPDGDCISASLAAYNYLKNKYSEKKLQVYFDDPSDRFSVLPGFDKISQDENEEIKYDLCFVLDCADIDRVGKFKRYLKEAKSSLLIDHHVTNEGFSDAFLIEPESSSASEALFTLLDEEFINKDVALCIYTGILHDTGQFAYTCTSKRTMEIAGKCMAYGIDFSDIISKTFSVMDYRQKRVLGRILSEMRLELDGKLAAGFLDLKTRKEFDMIMGKDLDGMIVSIRETEGVLAGVFVYETTEKRCKVSLRSNCDEIDVAKIAVLYGGGGHKRAAGCFMSVDFEKDLEEIKALISEQLKEHGIL